MKHLLTAAIAIVPLLATPASAATWAFGTPGSAANVASKSATAAGDGATLTAVARRFTPAHTTALTNVSQLLSTTAGGAALTIRTTVPGIGVTGGGDTVQIDTNSASLREAILITTNASQALRLTGLKLSSVDANDTLRIYGVDALGALTSIGFTTGLPARIAQGLDGAASFTSTNANGGTVSLTFNNPVLTPYFGYVFTTAVGGDVSFGGDLGQGYRLDALSGYTVPEPATWAMLLTGFGLVGASMRRRQRTVVA
ncbi:hypothetical protein GCM10007973_15200 [Polymorphobacter multimanifer]|uniref:Ice-binding protein C-terminal domain-containing protein n=1 Tax=Polymorphobacter multimanifer TaxID=1070431 RepID=A0A841L1M6_9SPHN|nr:PEPxxWA-CTERM sorting domain-containing protein [Polymorphobacter multimanifer]MBB6226216.1 hypothetical protein [Polymorphobacter multimanifer]GGI79562.1 hypothetical protein GCM10007973_15200 [Polymorphobacter multimanifer]